MVVPLLPAGKIRGVFLATILLSLALLTVATDPDIFSLSDLLDVGHVHHEHLAVLLVILAVIALIVPALPGIYVVIAGASLLVTIGLIDLGLRFFWGGR